MSSVKDRTNINKLATNIAEVLERTARLAEMVEALTELGNEDGAASFTIQQFCKRNSISESQYHKLRRAGRGPRTMCTGEVGVRISRQAEIDWIKAREAEAAGRDEDAA